MIKELIKVTRDAQFKARHELGHAMMLEYLGLPWEYITIKSDGAGKGGKVEHRELVPTDGNCRSHVLIKMAGKAMLLNCNYNIISVNNSIKCDHNEVEKFLYDAYPGYSASIIRASLERCLRKAVWEGRKILKREITKEHIDVIASEIVSRCIITRAEYLEILDKLTIGKTGET